MERQQTVTQAEWPIMELLWEAPRTLMEMVSALCTKHAWSKSTVTTMIRRMVDKGLIVFHTEGRTKIFHPAVSREDVTARETHSLLRRAYNGSVGLLVSAMADRHDLTKQDIDELYAILKQAEESAK
jgi:BlaI family penicillinase repressor